MFTTQYVGSCYIKNGVYKMPPQGSAGLGRGLGRARQGARQGSAGLGRGLGGTGGHRLCRVITLRSGVRLGQFFY